MQIVRDLAGYSYGQSDLVRRAMSKKKIKEMEKERKNFIYGNPESGVVGCIANGIDEETANRIFEEMEKFAEYAFNKSHAAGYAVVAYETAYLKTHYPLEFMASLLTSVINYTSKSVEYIMDCKRMGIEIAPPNINEGQWEFAVGDGKILYALGAVKGVGKEAIQTAVREREVNGIYKSLQDFVERTGGKGVNKRVIENLIKAGAFDCLDGTRKQLLMVYPLVVEQAIKDRKDNFAGQISLFDLGNEQFQRKMKLPDVGEFGKTELLAYEKEVLGLYLSGHPMEQYEELWRRNITHTMKDFEYYAEMENPMIRDGENVIIGGMVEDVRVLNTKDGKRIAYLTLEDMYGTVEITVFSRDYELERHYFMQDNKLFIMGSVVMEDEKPIRLIFRKLIPFDDVGHELWIQFDDKEMFVKEEENLRRLISEYDGTDSLIIRCKKENVYKRMAPDWDFLAAPELVEKLRRLYGEDNVKLTGKSVKKLLKNF